MKALFGDNWMALVLPTFLGLAVLLIVLALRPPKRVAIGASVFCFACFLIGVGLLVDEKMQAARMRLYEDCIDRAKMNSVELNKCPALIRDR